MKIFEVADCSNYNIVKKFLQQNLIIIYLFICIIFIVYIYLHSLFYFILY